MNSSGVRAKKAGSVMAIKSVMVPSGKQNFVAIATTFEGF